MKFGAVVHRFDRTGSTNDAAGEAAAMGAPEGTAFIAGEQTAGRGLRGRLWHSPPNLGLYVSFILRPPAEVHPLIPLAGGLAVHRTVLETTGVRTTLKWPNDVQHRGAKLAGILTEAVFSGSEIQYAVLGIGLNVGHRAEDFPPDLAGRAVSLMMITGSPPSRETLFFGLCRALDDVAGRLAAGNGSEIVRAFQEDMAFRPGDEIRLSTSEGEFTGVFRGLTDRGGLAVVTQDGEHILFSGEISAGNG